MEKLKYITLALVLLFFMDACNESETIRNYLLSTTLEFEYENMSIQENVGKYEIPVSLSSVATSEVTLSVAVEYRPDLEENPAIQAKEGVHFKIPVKTLTIPVGSSYGVFEIEIIDDITINEDRKFDLRIEAISGGATSSSMSQITRISLKNDDFWPEVTFPTARKAMLETDTCLVIPLEVGGGVIRNPFNIEVEVESLTAREGVDFTVEKKTFLFTEENRLDSIVIHLNAPDPMDENISFKLRYSVDESGITGSNPEMEIVLQKVFKYVDFGKRVNWMFQSYEKMSVPVVFSGLRSSRDVVAKIKVKSVEGGLELTDINLPSEYITVKGDTTVQFEFEITKSLFNNFNAKVELEIEEVTGGEMGSLLTTSTRMREVDFVDREEWFASSNSEATNEGSKGGKAQFVLDGQEDSYWHTIYSPSSTPLPHVLVIDFGGNCVQPEKIAMRHRNGWKDAYKTKIYFNTDPETMGVNAPSWVYVGDMIDTAGVGGGTVMFWVNIPIKAYGLKMEVVQLATGRNTTAMSEVNVSGLVVTE